MKKRALLSVSDKAGIVELARELVCLGYEIVSTGGTVSVLQSNGLRCIDVSDVTQYPECLDGRVKTLHPSIHAGILYLRQNVSHVDFVKGNGIVPIDIVVVNLYPFKQVINRQDSSFDCAIDNIDIGGPSMLRAAAKNYQSVLSVCDPQDYDIVLQLIKSGNEDDIRRFSFELACKAYSHTAQYDSIVAQYLCFKLGLEYSQSLSLSYNKVQDLRYGENPHQTAAFYKDAMSDYGIASCTLLQGKELSYNNINDSNGALLLLREFDIPTAVVVKHSNPCGVASHSDIVIAYQLAHDCDKQAIFGGIVAVNVAITSALALMLSKVFLEIVLAPGFDYDALRILAQKPSLRLIKTEQSKHLPHTFGKEIRHVYGGILVQSVDDSLIFDTKVVTDAQVTQDVMQQLLFAYKVVKHIKSNAIVVTKDMSTVGFGIGQTSRIRACEYALHQAQNQEAQYLASDAFFPFDDCVELANRYGIRYIIQPGGSKNDQASIDACNKHGIGMVFVGQRHFKH